MKFDLMLGDAPWSSTASLAKGLEEVGFSGVVFTETSHAPWMSLAAAAMTTQRLELATGIAVAFARSPMVTAVSAWELADNSRGRFRLGLGSQVRAHIERRYGMPFDPPGPRLADYVRAVKACFRAFAEREPLNYQGTFYSLTLLPKQWKPSNHAYGDIKIDVAAVNPWMCRMAASVADGIHVHPLHSSVYLKKRLLPEVEKATRETGRNPKEVELTVPVFVVPGDTPEERAPMLAKARGQIAFYGSTRNYSFQFDDLGFEGTSALLNDRLKAGDIAGMADVINDEILSHFAVVGRWDEIADALRARYEGIASRLVIYLAEESIASDAKAMGKWGEIARAVTAG
ncbi:MAG: TIGR03617 family F420-dependent LLM class oxidoreductase [Actinomycetota bacterium]|nr:MAG: TIGR03617 family F420-dependent LLM class oxidoreductase [Actinomycetota bacterium]